MDEIFEIWDLRVEGVGTGSDINRGYKSSSYCTCCCGTLSSDSLSRRKNIFVKMYPFHKIGCLPELPIPALPSVGPDTMVY
jgi:hypothetical protein